MIINNLPKSIILNGSIEDKHINSNKLSASVIKLDNNFSVLNDGSLSINIKLLNEKPTTIEDNFIYLVSENNIINSLSDGDKEKINKLIINNNGSKFLSNDGTYKTLYPFIKIYYNFTEFSNNDLMNVFNEMIYPSILYAEINDDSYPFDVGHLMITKISQNTANITYNGINQHIYTRTINNNQISNWEDISNANTAKKLENVIYINKAKFDGSQSITSSEMNLATGNDTIFEFDNLEKNTWIRIAESNNNLAVGSFLINIISNDLSFNLDFDISFNKKIYFLQKLYDYNENSQIRIIYDNNKCYIDLKIIKNINNGKIKIHSYTDDFILPNDLFINDNINNNVQYFDLIDDEIRLNNNLTTFITTLSLNNEWIDTGISNLSNGSYLIQIILINEKIMFTGYFSWYNNTNILDDENEIILHKSSNNPDINNLNIYLRIVQDSSTRLQISSNNEMDVNIEFKIKRLI